MSSEIFWLYLLTRLNDIKEVVFVFLLVGSIGYGVFMFIWLAEGMPEKFKKFTNGWKALAWAAVVVVIVPCRNDVAFILAGTGVIEAAKTDTAQRIAGKSVTVVEKYLDELLKEEKK